MMMMTVCCARVDAALCPVFTHCTYTPNQSHHHLVCTTNPNQKPNTTNQGLAANYLKVVPSIAIAFVTYEQVKEALGVEFRISD